MREAPTAVVRPNLDRVGPNVCVTRLFRCTLTGSFVEGDCLEDSICRFASNQGAPMRQQCAGDNRKRRRFVCYNVVMAIDVEDEGPIADIAAGKRATFSGARTVADSFCNRRDE
jgi:hypothetical protein